MVIKILQITYQQTKSRLNRSRRILKATNEVSMLNAVVIGMIKNGSRTEPWEKQTAIMTGMLFCGISFSPFD